jgi:CheY-like chemotaxis protein
VTASWGWTTCFAKASSPSRAGPPLPTVVLLDIRLPRVSGLEVLERLRADPRTQVLPVVMLTSSDEDRDRLASYAHGANSFVRKPIDFAEFITVTTRLGLYWMATNEPPQR